MDYRFYIGLVNEDVDGSIKSVDDFKDLERDYVGLRYKSLTGVNSYGTPRVYEETFAESNEALVITSDVLQQTDLVLTLYFFGHSYNVEDDIAYSEASSVYHKFYQDIRGKKLVWYDTARKRKVLMRLSSATPPKEDRLHSLPYICAEFKFKNIYGESFELSDGIFPPTTLTV